MTERGTRGWRIGRIGGADVHLHPSLLVATLLLVVVFAPHFRSLGSGEGYLTALVFVIGLYVSILVHELAHVVVARLHRMEVVSVDLHMMGGATNVRGRSRTPWQEFATSAVGPLTSLLIGMGCLSAAPMTSGAPAAMLSLVGQLNVVLAVFNALPSPPLDGGRMTTALGWWARGSERKGLEIAKVTGRIVAVALVGVGLLLLVQNSTNTGTALVFTLVAGFLWSAAGSHTAQAVRRTRVDALEVSALMRTVAPPHGAVPIRARLSGRDLLVAMAENPADFYAVFDEDGNVTGTLHSADVDRFWKESR